MDTVRQSELDEAVQLCAQAASEGYVGAIVGDLNCGPEASAGNYEHLKKVGFADALERFDLGCTWDQASPLNNLPVFKGCPSQSWFQTPCVKTAPPLPSLDHLKAQAAAARPRASSEQLGGFASPQELAPQPSPKMAILPF